MYSIGIDSGSTTTKGVLYNGEIVKKVIMKTSARPRESILSIFASRLAIEEEVFFTGGLSKSLEFKKRLEKCLGLSIKTSNLSQYAGAIGAAVIGFNKIK